MFTLKRIVYGALVWIGAGLWSADVYSTCGLGACIDARPTISGSRPSSGGGGYSPPVYTPPQGPTPQELQQRREMSMHDANDLGSDAYRTGDYVTAIRYFEQALESEPDDPTLQENLRAARAAFKAQQDQRTREAQAARGAQARAIDEARSAQFHGENAARSPSSGEQQRVFDTTGNRVSGSGSVVDARNPPKRVQIPPSLANNPEILRLQGERTTLVSQRANLEQKLTGIREQKARGEGNRGQLEVQEAQAKQQISNVTSQIAVVDVKTESFVINLTRETPQPQTARTQ